MSGSAVIAESTPADKVQQLYVSTAPVQTLGAFSVDDNSSDPAEFMTAVSLEQLSGGVEPYQGYLGITADLPGIQPVCKSVNATYQLIRFISERRPAPKEEQPANSPDVGCYGSPFLQLCSV